jgi:hypothetical protein
MINAAKYKPKTVYVAYIAATPERVWQALTDPAFSSLYFFGFAVDVEPKHGGAFYHRYPDGRVHTPTAASMCAARSSTGRRRTAFIAPGWSRARRMCVAGMPRQLRH